MCDAVQLVHAALNGANCRNIYTGLVAVSPARAYTATHASPCSWTSTGCRSRDPPARSAPVGDSERCALTCPPATQKHSTQREDVFLLSACSFTACLLRDAGQVMTQAADDKSVQMLVLGSFGRKEKGASAGCATCHGTRRALPARSVSERQALVPGKVQGVWPMARMRARL